MLDVWNDVTYPPRLTDREKYAIMIPVHRLVGERGVDPTKLIPPAVPGSPLPILLLVFQRRIVSGATAGAVKWRAGLRGGL